jgi:hypothetical protein
MDGPEGVFVEEVGMDAGEPLGVEGVEADVGVEGTRGQGTH